MKKRIGIFLLGVCCSLLVTPQEIHRGKASYYADRLHGRRMSNGARYHRDSMTCAHLKYPFGTLLRVKNLANKKEVVVKVTDRGPFSKKYIIDLSRAAAKALGIIGTGFSQVEVSRYQRPIVPFKLEEEKPEIPELDLEYSEAATYPTPAWQNDSVKATNPVGHQNDSIKTKKAKAIQPVARPHEGSSPKKDKAGNEH